MRFNSGKGKEVSQLFRQFTRKGSIKIILPSVLAVVLFVAAVFGIILPSYQATLMDSKKAMIRELTQVAWEMLMAIEHQERKGELTRKEAQALAIEHIREMRYGTDRKDYFWINDMRPFMVMHPYRTDLEGLDVSGFTDPNGKHLFQAFVSIVEKQGQGYVDYLWQWKDDSSRIVPKLSYVKGFPAWGWIIGTGIYLEDVHMEIERLTRQLTVISAVIALLVSFLSVYITVRALRTEEKRRQAEAELEEYQGQLEQMIEGRTTELREANTRLHAEIIEREEAEAIIRRQNDFLHSVIESLPYPFYVVNVSDHTVVLSNTAAADQGKCQGEKCYTITHRGDKPCDPGQDECPVAEVVKTRKPTVLEHRHFDPEGEEEYVEVHGYPIFDDQGRVVQMIEYAMDISERKKLEEKLRHASITDEMTGLYNRRGFLELARNQLQLAGRNDNESVVLYIDLDNMKWINDNLGHEIGDQALIETATLLKNLFRESDIISRLGGDEFVVFMSTLSNGETERSVVKRFEDELKALNLQEGRKYQLLISAGTVHFDPNAPCSIEELLSKADTLMYEHKKRKKYA